MRTYSSKLLLEMLARLLALQIIAVQTKAVEPSLWNTIKGADSLVLTAGICSNIHYVILSTGKVQQHCHLNDLLVALFVACPSFSGSISLPVHSTETIGYGVSAQSMWGDHPYADNRRQIIQECIDQLHLELQSRGYQVG